MQKKILKKNVKTDNNIFYYSQVLKDKCQISLRYFNLYSFSNFEANKIIKNIYLGSIDSVYDKENLQKFNIKNVISVLPEFNAPFPNDFNYFIINANDTTQTNLFDIFEETNNFIEESLNNDEAILIHCMMGRSRSVTILSAYIIKTFGFTPTKTIEFIKSIRPIIEPNPYFLQQLDEYYKLLYIDNYDI
jgi:hypothetical protein